LTLRTPRPSSVRTNTAFSLRDAKVDLPEPATPWIRIRGGAGAVDYIKDESEIAISGSPLASGKSRAFGRSGFAAAVG
jgi:hypothetical protein